MFWEQHLWFLVYILPLIRIRGSAYFCWSGFLALIPGWRLKMVPEKREFQETTQLGTELHVQVKIIFHADIELVLCLVVHTLTLEVSHQWRSWCPATSNGSDALRWALTWPFSELTGGLFCLFMLYIYSW